MKKLPEVNIDYSNLYNMLMAPIRAKLLLTGIDLNIFNHLSELKSAKSIAQAIGAHPQNTKVFLDCLSAIDLIEKKNSLYKNTPIAETFLVETSSTYLGRLFNAMKPDDQFLQNLPKMVKEGPPPQPEKPEFSEEAFAQAVVLFADTERAGYAQEAINVITKLPEFSSFVRMLDLGGGPGLIGMAIVDAHPNMKGTIFDLPPVVAEAKKYIKEYGMEERVDVLGGDFNLDSIGEGYDLIFSSAALQFAKDIDSVVKKAYDALNPGGVFVSIFPFGMTHEGTKPENTVLGLLSSALMGQEAVFDKGYIADSMVKAGFKTTCSRTIDTFMGLMELDIARK